MTQDYNFLDDARVAGMGLNEQRTLFPEEMPKPGESRYLILHTDEPDVFPKWENDPDGYYWGHGRGLPKMDEVPRFRLDARKEEITQPDIWRWRQVYLITKRLLDLIAEYDSGAVEARLADFRFSDSLSPDEPYYLADFVQKIEAVDVKRSVNICQTSDSSAEPRCSHKLPYALLPDIPQSVHVFREATNQHDWGGGSSQLFFSRAIIDEMVKRQFRRIVFHDPAIGPGQTQGDIIFVNGNGTGKPE